jgi:filamentous hemagglutinin
MFGVPKWARWVAGAVAAVAIVAIAIIVLPIIAGAVALTAGIAIGVAALGAIAATGISIAARGKIDGTTAIHAVIGAASGLLLAAGSALVGSIMAASTAATTLVIGASEVAQKSTPYIDKGRSMVTSDGFRMTEYYFNKLTSSGRADFASRALNIIQNATEVTPDPEGYEGVYRYVYNSWELLYNPLTQEISHLGPLK